MLLQIPRHIEHFSNVSTTAAHLCCRTVNIIFVKINVFKSSLQILQLVFVSCSRGNELTDVSLLQRMPNVEVLALR